MGPVPDQLSSSTRGPIGLGCEGPHGSVCVCEGRNRSRSTASAGEGCRRRLWVQYRTSCPRRRGVRSDWVARGLMVAFACVRGATARVLRRLPVRVADVGYGSSTGPAVLVDEG